MVPRTLTLHMRLCDTARVAVFCRARKKFAADWLLSQCSLPSVIPKPSNFRTIPADEVPATKSVIPNSLAAVKCARNHGSQNEAEGPAASDQWHVHHLSAQWN